MVKVGGNIEDYKQSIQFFLSLSGNGHSSFSGALLQLHYFVFKLYHLSHYFGQYGQVTCHVTCHVKCHVTCHVMCHLTCLIT